MWTLKRKVIKDYCTFMNNLYKGKQTPYCHIINTINVIEECNHFNEAFIIGALRHES